MVKNIKEKILQNKYNVNIGQLASLASPVTHLARTGDIIVDFCSGSGHLGLLMAHLIPHATGW